MKTIISTIINNDLTGCMNLIMENEIINFDYADLLHEKKWKRTYAETWYLDVVDYFDYKKVNSFKELSVDDQYDFYQEFC